VAIVVSAVSQLPLETFDTMNDSWGCSITDRNCKTVKHLIHYIGSAAGQHANFLLNVGTMHDGTIQSEFADNLKAKGNRIKQNGESIYGTGGGVLKVQE
jgi:alpha-L-fucosidase